MEPWGWIVVYLVGFTLVQLLLFRYVSDGRSLGGLSLGSGETSAPQSVETSHAPGESQPQRADGTREGEGVCCPQCGTRNDDDGPFTYCRECLGQLR